MSFWNFLFGKNRAITIQDTFFGELKNYQGHFEGQMYFKPTDNIVEIFISNDIIQQYHRLFFQELEERYESLKSPLKEKLEDDFFKNMDETFEIKDFDNEFSLTFISLPKTKNDTWELSFDCIHDENHIFTGFFNHWQLLYVNMDG